MNKSKTTTKQIINPKIQQITKNKHNFTLIFTKLNQRINYLHLLFALGNLLTYKRKTDKISFILVKIQKRKLIQSFLSLKDFKNKNEEKNINKNALRSKLCVAIVINVLTKIQRNYKNHGFKRILQIQEQLLNFNTVKVEAIKSISYISKSFIVRTSGLQFLNRLKLKSDKLRYSELFLRKFNKFCQYYRYNLQKESFQFILLFGYQRQASQRVQQRKQKNKIKKSLEFHNFEAIRTITSQLAVLKKEVQSQLNSKDKFKKDQAQRKSIMNIKYKLISKSQAQLNKIMVENNILRFQLHKINQNLKISGNINNLSQNMQQKVQKLHKILIDISGINTQKFKIDQISNSERLSQKSQIKQTIGIKQLSIICQRYSIDLNNSLKNFIINKEYQIDQNIQLKTLINMFQDQYSSNNSQVNISASGSYKSSFQQNLNLRELLQNVIKMLINYSVTQKNKRSNQDQIKSILSLKI